MPTTQKLQQKHTKATQKVGGSAKKPVMKAMEGGKAASSKGKTPRGGSAKSGGLNMKAIKNLWPGKEVRNNNTTNNNTTNNNTTNLGTEIDILKTEVTDSSDLHGKIDKLDKKIIELNKYTNDLVKNAHLRIDSIEADSMNLKKYFYAFYTNLDLTTRNEIENKFP